MKSDEIGGYLVGVFHGAVIGALLTLALNRNPSDWVSEKKIVEQQGSSTLASPSVR